MLCPPTYLKKLVSERDCTLVGIHNVQPFFKQPRGRFAEIQDLLDIMSSFDLIG